MRLHIERGDLLRALSHVASVVERRTTLPILSNVLLVAGDSVLELKGTDLEREVVESVPATVSRPGATTVAAHLLYDIVRKLPDGSQVELATEGDEQRLAVMTRQARFHLPMLSADEFPDLTAGELPHRFEIDARDLKRLIEKARFAISTEETRYYLTGIYLHVADPTGKPMLRAVATDGHRLARVEFDCPSGAEGMPGVIVPRKTVNELHRLIEDQNAPVDVALSDSRIQFACANVIMTSKLIEGTFPDYNRVIPQSNDKQMIVETGEFATAVDRVSTVSTDRGRAVKLALGAGRLTLSVYNPDGGSATEEIEVNYSAEPLEIGFNARYLLDIASQLDSGEAEFMLADPGSPTTIRDHGDASAIYVLMPMRV
ncbi:MAG: DNA polymerase III subunit beta [Rhizobiales bacterium]|nr:DNA polymerase III subunit beta [Hyphomicrobiales bacterium]